MLDNFTMAMGMRMGDLLWLAREAPWSVSGSLSLAYSYKHVLMVLCPMDCC